MKLVFNSTGKEFQISNLMYRWNNSSINWLISHLSNYLQNEKDFNRLRDFYRDFYDEVTKKCLDDPYWIVPTHHRKVKTRKLIDLWKSSRGKHLAKNIGM